MNLKLTTREWVQILGLAVCGTTAWVTLHSSVSALQSTVAGLQQQINQVRQDYLRRDVDSQHDGQFDVQIADIKERLNRLEDHK